MQQLGGLLLSTDGRTYCIIICHASVLFQLCFVYILYEQRAEVMTSEELLVLVKNLKWQKALRAPSRTLQQMGYCHASCFSSLLMKHVPYVSFVQYSLCSVLTF